MKRSTVSSRARCEAVSLASNSCRRFAFGARFAHGEPDSAIQPAIAAIGLLLDSVELRVPPGLIHDRLGLHVQNEFDGLFDVH